MNRKSRIGKWVGVGLLAVVAMLALASGAYYAWLMTPPPMPRTVEEAADLLQSPRYARLPQSRRFEYMQRAAELFDSAPRKKQRELIRAARQDKASRELYEQAVRDRIFMEVRKYVLADAFDRQIMVDRVIAMQRIMESRQQRRPSSGQETDAQKARRERRERDFMTKFQQQIEQGNPQHQAYAGEFLKAIMSRRQAMGLPPIPQPPR